MITIRAILLAACVLAATVVSATAAGVPYAWYCVTGGPTGHAEPKWPAPGEFTDSIVHGVLW